MDEDDWFYDDISREQLVTILYRYAQFMDYDTSKSDDLSAFTDANAISAWALPAMQWAVAGGLIEGTGFGKISPTGDATRAQVAAILNRFIENVAE